MLPAAPLGAPSVALRPLVGHGWGPAAVVEGAVVVVGEVVVVDVVGLEEGVAVVDGPVDVVDVVGLADLCADDPHAAKAAPTNRAVATFVANLALSLPVRVIDVLTVLGYPSGRQPKRRFANLGLSLRRRS